MSKTITIDVFDPASIDRAVNEIREYSRWVQRKTDELRQRIAELISNQAQAVFNSSVADNGFMVINGNAVDDTRFGEVTVTVQPEGDNTTVIIANGKDAVFMEFGAGVYYNGAVGSSPNPWGTDLGFTIGSYGKGNGRKEVWGYRGEDGEIHLTHGAPASIPLYKAVQSVSRDIVKIAREVFASD
jgi:hypothetical protein